LSEAIAEATSTVGAVLQNAGTCSSNQASLKTADEMATWRNSYKQVRVAPASLFKHAPLSATLAKIARNTHLNPQDRPLSDAELDVLKLIIEKHHALIKRLEHEKGLARTDFLMRGLQSGALTPLSQLASLLDESEMARLNDKLGADGDPEEGDYRMRSMVKEAVMAKLGLEAAITTPDGRVYFAPSGAVNSAMPELLQLQRFLQDEFIMSISAFFFAGGYIDAATRDSILTSYFRT
jgi:hypothetical protein